MNTKYVKVPVSERLPDESGKYLIYHKGFMTCLQSSFSPNDSEKIEYYKEKIEYWLEEVPDHSEEMLSLLEELVSENSWENTWSDKKEKAQQLINKVKDNENN